MSGDGLTQFLQLVLPDRQGEVIPVVIDNARHTRGFIVKRLLCLHLGWRPRNSSVSERVLQGDSQRRWLQSNGLLARDVRCSSFRQQQLRLGPGALIDQNRGEKVIRSRTSREWAPTDVSMLVLLFLEIVHDFAKLVEPLRFVNRLGRRWR